jgi:hypothetical protein
VSIGYVKSHVDTPANPPHNNGLMNDSNNSDLFYSANFYFSSSYDVKKIMQEITSRIMVIPKPWNNILGPYCFINYLQQSMLPL